MNKNGTKPYIHITKGVREKLMKDFKVSGVTLWKALFFQSDSELAQKIRAAAYENYGILMNDLPCMETFHDYDKYMRQYLDNDTLIELNKNDGSGDVFLRGELVRHYENIPFRDIRLIQEFARTLK